MKMTVNNKVSVVGKKILFFLFAVLLCGNFFPSQAWATKEYTIESVPNVRLSNRLNHVSNPDGIIQPDDVIRINQLLTIVEDSLGIEVAVIAVESIGDNSPRMFATDLFKYWGLGKKGKDNGLLIQLVTAPSQRSVVFETGYGLEGILPDAICYRLQQRYMIQDLKEGNYSAGMLKGVAAVKHYLMTSDYERAAMTGRRQVSTTNNGTDNLSLWLFSAMSILFLGVIIFAGYLKQRPRICPRCGKKSFVYRGRQTIMSPTYYSEGVEEDVFRCSNCGHEHRNRHTIDRLHRGGGGPIIFGGDLGRFTGGSSGGSWGGGGSGGGGAESRF